MAELIDYVESAAEDTNPLGTYELHLLATDAEPEGDRLIIFSGAGGTADAAADLEVQLTDVADAELVHMVFGISSTGEYHGLSAIAHSEFGAGYIKYRRTNHASASAKMRQASIATLLLGPNDHILRGVGAESFASTSYEDYDGCELTFTPIGTGDYLFFAFALLDSGSTNAGRIKLVRTGGTIIAEQLIGARESVDIFPWTVHRRVTLTAGTSTTVKVQARAEIDTVGISISQVCIAALYVPDLRGVYYAESTGATAVFSTKANKTSKTFCPPRELQHLIIGSSQSESDGASASHEIGLDYDEETLLLCNYTNTGTNLVRSTFGAYARTVPRAFHRAATTGRDSGGVSTGTIRNSMVSIIDPVEIGPHTVWVKGKTQILGKTQVL